MRAKLNERIATRNLPPPEPKIEGPFERGSFVHYACTRCKVDTPREMITVKKAVFLAMGKGGRTMRSRRTAWLCPDCIADDADWVRPKFQFIQDVK